MKTAYGGPLNLNYKIQEICRVEDLGLYLGPNEYPYLGLRGFSNSNSGCVGLNTFVGEPRLIEAYEHAILFCY